MKRILYLDIIRIVACLMIIAMHAPIPHTGLNSYILSTDFPIDNGCNGKVATNRDRFL